MIRSQDHMAPWIFFTLGGLCIHLIWQEGRNEVFYLMMHSTHFTYGYVLHMLKDHSDGDRGNRVLPLGLFFLISSKGSFICNIPQIG